MGLSLGRRPSGRCPSSSCTSAACGRKRAMENQKKEERESTGGVRVQPYWNNAHRLQSEYKLIEPTRQVCCDCSACFTRASANSYPRQVLEITAGGRTSVWCHTEKFEGKQAVSGTYWGAFSVGVNTPPGLDFNFSIFADVKHVYMLHITAKRKAPLNVQKTHGEPG